MGRALGNARHAAKGDAGAGDFSGLDRHVETAAKCRDILVKALRDFITAQGGGLGGDGNACDKLTNAAVLFAVV